MEEKVKCKTRGGFRGVYPRASQLECFNREFFSSWSGDLAYFVGLFAADGCVFSRKDGGYQLSLGLQSRDKAVLVKLKDRLCLASSVNDGVYKTSSCRYGYAMSSRLQFCSVSIGRWLEEVGIGSRKSLTLDKLKVPREFMSEFVRGFIDGDGCWSRRKGMGLDHKLIKFHLTLSILGPESFLEWLREEIKIGSGVDAYPVRKVPNCRVWHLDYSCKRACVVRDWVYSVGDLCIERKKEKAFAYKLSVG